MKTLRENTGILPTKTLAFFHIKKRKISPQLSSSLNIGYNHVCCAVTGLACVMSVTRLGCVLPKLCGVMTGLGCVVTWLGYVVSGLGCAVTGLGCTVAGLGCVVTG